MKQHSFRLVQTLLSLMIVLHAVEGFSGGAPAQACGTLTPDPALHLNDPQLGSVPYEVDLSPLSDGADGFEYEPGETYTLMFRSIVQNLAFRGVLVQGRVVADESVAGTFTDVDPLTRLSSCTPPNSALTHNSNAEKTSITIEWTAPPAGTGAVRMGFGVVVERTVFWGDQRSPPIAERAMVETTTDIPTMTTEEVAMTTEDVAMTTEDVPMTTEDAAMTTDTTGSMTTDTTGTMTTGSVNDITTSTDSGMGVGGDPHFSIVLPTNKQLCYSVQGEAGFIFNLMSNEEMTMNALFVADSVREEVTWIGGLGIVIKNAPYKNSHSTRIGFDATKRTITVGKDMLLKAENIDSLTFRSGKVIISQTKRGYNCSCFPVLIDLQDVGLNFSVHFVKNNRLDMTWESVQNQPQNSHGIIGQFFRAGVDIDETRHLLMLPDMEPVAVMRKPIWHFMERDSDPTNRKMCWAAMNPGYQGKKLILGSYLDYAVDDLFTTKFKM